MKMDQSENNVTQVKQEALEYDHGTCPQNNQSTLAVSDRLLDQFCRLCLRQRPDLVPLLSRIQDLPLPEVFRAITGLEVSLKDTYPLKVCPCCMTMLDCAFDIRVNFTESHRILQTFVHSRTQTLIDYLRDYQQGARATGETLAEKMLREGRDLGDQRVAVEPHETAPSPPCVIIPYPQEQIEFHVQIKQDPDLILDTDALSISATKPTETITNDVESSVETSCKVRNVVSTKRPKRPGLKSVRNKLNPNKCYICNQVFETTEAVQTHIRMHVEMIPYECSTCTNETGQPVQVTRLKLLHKHFRMHACALKCPMCPHRTSTKVALRGHMQINHGENAQTEYTCDLCEAKLVSKATLNGHMRQHKALNEGRFPCPHCERKFRSKQHLARHLLCHTNENPYQCTSCDKNFKTQSELSRHELCHTGEKGYKCDACGMSYRARSNLKKHIFKNHTTTAQIQPKEDDCILSCDFEGCDYSTTDKIKYNHHKAKHELKYQCPQCPKRYAFKKRLTQHLAAHSDVKNFHCDQCDKSYLTKYSLNVHMAGHSNERSHSCEICGKSFFRERSLKLHRVIHTERISSFECRYCGMKFKHHSSQVRHEKAHKETATEMIDSNTEASIVTVKDEPIN